MHTCLLRATEGWPPECNVTPQRISSKRKGAVRKPEREETIHVKGAIPDLNRFEGGPGSRGPVRGQSPGGCRRLSDRGLNVGRGLRCLCIRRLCPCPCLWGWARSPRGIWRVSRRGGCSTRPSARVGAGRRRGLVCVLLARCMPTTT
jgi:hypothetical protein